MQKGPEVSPPEWVALRERLSRDRARMGNLRREEHSILRGIQSLERVLRNTRGALRKLSQHRDRLELEAESLSEELVDTDIELGATRHQIGQRLAAMHRLRRVPIRALSERAADKHQARILRDRLHFVMDYDASLLATAKQKRHKKQALLGALEVKEAHLDQAADELRAQAMASRRLQDDRTQLLRAVREERRSAEQLATELRRAAEQLVRELGVTHGREAAPAPALGGFSAQRGRLPWPVPGRVELAFGKKVEVESKMVLAQNGLDIRAPLLTPVRAVFGGKVAYSGPFFGLGQLLILEHGEGYFTVSAHLESVGVRKGQSVRQHQVVGHVGDTDSPKGAYLYFEIRRGAVPLDPSLWLAP